MIFTIYGIVVYLFILRSLSRIRYFWISNVLFWITVFYLIFSGPLPCHICGKISIHKMALSKHINRVHKQLEKSYHCHICDKSFGEKRTLKQHISKVHRDHKTYNEYMWKSNDLRKIHTENKYNMINI